jgi:3-hydroxyisobutyrate dehydrogenase
VSSAGATVVGFIGLGAMGTPMVTQLSEKGHRVLVHDVDAGRRSELARLDGVSAAETLAELADLRVVVTMLPDSTVVNEVVAGSGGLLEVLAPGALIVDMSSSDPRRTVELAEAAAAAGHELIDAPVSGGIAQATIGRLTIMVGGRPEQLERCRHVLEAMGSSIVPVGSVGAGHAMKALNNVLSAVGLSIACEAVEVGRRFGLDPDVMLQILNTSTGRNHATENKIAQFVLSESYDSGFRLRLMLKDLVTAVDLAHEVGAATPITEACLALWQAAAEVLPPDADQTRIAVMQASPQRAASVGGIGRSSEPAH